MRGPGKFYGRAILSVCMAAMFSVAPAQAQPEQRTIEATAGEYWHHQHSGMAMPARLGGFDRQYIRDLTENELDVYAQYHGDDKQTRLTLFVYRAAVNNVPLWFDAAQQSLRNNIKMLPGVREYLVSAFTPPGQSGASGLMAVYALPEGAFKSTGVAMLPLNGWLVKIRFSSAELSAKDMAAALEPLLRDIHWPDNIKSGPAAAPILPCKNELDLTDRVKRVVPSPTDAIADAISGSFMGLLAAKEVGEGRENSVTYCRDPQDFGPLSIYRSGEADNGYLMPLGDAGRAASVHTSQIGGLIGGSKGERYTPVLMQLDQNIIFPDLDRLPTPDVLLAATGDDAATASVSTWPQSTGSTITIHVPDDEDQ